MYIIINDTRFAIQINSSFQDYPITLAFLWRVCSVLNIGAVTSMTSDSFDFIDGPAILLALKMLSILCHAVVTREIKREGERKREWGWIQMVLWHSGNTTKRDIAYRFRNPPRFPLTQSRLIPHREQWFPRKFLFPMVKMKNYKGIAVHIFYIKNVRASQVHRFIDKIINPRMWSNCEYISFLPLFYILCFLLSNHNRKILRTTNPDRR